MFKKLTNFFKEAGGVLSLECVLCRLLAAWCGYTAYYLMRGGDFSRLEYAQNTPLVSILASTALLFFVYSCVGRLAPAYNTDSWFLIAGATLCVAQWLMSYENRQNAFLFFIAVVVAYGFFVVYFLQKNSLLWKRWNPGSRTVWITAAVIGAFGGFVIAVTTCCRYLTFSSPNFDFGLFVNMFHHMKETGLPLCTSERDVLLSHFAVHISPIYYVLLPFYVLVPSPLTLQIGQAAVLASGVVPVLLLCRQLRLSGKCSILVTLLYSLYPALSTGCFYDIHENCFLAPLLLWLFYFFERGKPGWMYLFAFLTLMVKEDAAVYVALFGLYVLLSKKRLRQGLVLLCGALAYFGIALWVLQASGIHYAALYTNATPNPAIDGPMVNRFGNLIFQAGDGLMGAVKTAFLNPGYLLTQLFSTRDNGWEKFVYFLQLFLPLGFLPICTHKPSRWLLSAPVLINLLTEYPYQYDIGFQYHFGVTAFLLYATINNLSERKAVTRRNALGFAAAACCCLYLTYVVPAFRYSYKDWEEGKDKYAQMEAILDTVPQEASVCCSTFLLAHIADRAEVYELAYHDNVGDVDYVIFDGRYPIENNQMEEYIRQGYAVKREYEGLITILAKRTD